MPVGGTIETISRQNVCLYATYDQGLAADISRGDPEPTVNQLLVRHDPVGGRFGGRMVVDARDNEWAEDEIRYRAPGNFPYTSPGDGAGGDFEPAGVWSCDVSWGFGVNSFFGDADFFGAGK